MVNGPIDVARQLRMALELCRAITEVSRSSAPVVACMECGNDYAAGYCPHGN